MTDARGYLFSVKIQIEVTKCVYCGYILEFRPREIVDARPPVKGDS